MIVDDRLKFCTDLVHNGAATVIFTDTVDILNNRDLGSGRAGLWLHIHVTTAFAGLIAATFQLFLCATTTINIVTPPLDQAVAEGQYALGTLGVNAHLMIPLQKPTISQIASFSVTNPGAQQNPFRFLIGQMVPSGTATGGKWTARLTTDPAIGSFAYPTSKTVI